MPLQDLLEAGLRPLHVPKDSNANPIEEFPDEASPIEEFPDPTTTASRRGVNPLASVLDPMQLFDPVNRMKEAVVRMPAPQATLPAIGGLVGFGLGGQPGAVAGGEAGLLMGRELQRSRDVQAGKPSDVPEPTLRQTASDLAFLGATSAGAFLPEVSIALKAMPFAQMASTAVGGGVGAMLSQMVLGKKPDVGQAMETGLETGVMSGLVSKAVTSASLLPELSRALGARWKLKLGSGGLFTDVAHAFERTEFIKQVQQDIERTIAQSGEGITERMSDPSLKIAVAPVTQRLEDLAVDNPGLHKTILRSADAVGERALVTKYFPQVMEPPLREIGGMPVRAVTKSGRPLSSQQVPASVTEQILKQAGAHGSSPDVPDTMSGEEAQQLKKVFRESFKDALNRKRPMDYTQRHMLHLYNELKSSILKSDPSMEKQFEFHTHLSSSFRQIEGKLRDIDTLESSMEQFFGGSGSQAAFKTLLSPEVHEQALDFARGHNIGIFSTGVIMRMLRFGAMVPLYLKLSEFRSKLRQASR